METLNKYKYIILIELVLLATAFYWYGYRPSQIRTECANEAIQTNNIVAYTANGQNAETGYNFFVQRCLNEHGL
jgi:hypothetical protein